MKEPGKSRKTCKTCRFCRQLGRISMGRFDLGRFRPDPWFFLQHPRNPDLPEGALPAVAEGAAPGGPLPRTL